LTKFIRDGRDSEFFISADKILPGFLELLFSVLLDGLLDGGLLGFFQDHVTINFVVDAHVDTWILHVLDVLLGFPVVFGHIIWCLWVDVDKILDGHFFIEVDILNLILVLTVSGVVL